ncbi:MAG: hypothetical protein A3J62_01800 [Candidatus Buchananbacteria bacterium RIFCSPHIGHO2_02_FULL_38_8]|uniref:Uncharacterized protein n=1 Tax=Candidatus Buchananbacteria bacterium RIFCSPHIGHO2_02_FULL_38_8 TaxID=1797538 RepID=A0A1G1Y4A9_9BACT|nr:MAG: hypothetical protein A3J62_01800 [Candidatus Buchananbacteria bacterium RIFCSPHIGHO2_02_FULL_38_8]
MRAKGRILPLKLLITFGYKSNCRRHKNFLKFHIMLAVFSVLLTSKVPQKCWGGKFSITLIMLFIPLAMTLSCHPKPRGDFDIFRD